MNRKVAPIIIDPINFDLKLKLIEKFTLDNGVPVYSINSGAEDVMMVELVFFSGNCFEKKNLIAATANYLLKNGTSQKTAFQLNEHFEFHGSFLSRACYNETATITLHTLSKHIHELLPVMQSLVQDSIFPDDELATYQQNMKQALQVNLKKSNFVASRLIDTYLFGKNHPYGKYSSNEDFDAATKETVLSFYKKKYQQGNCMIFIAGKFLPSIETTLNNFFGTLSIGNNFQIPETPLSFIEKPGEKFNIINDETGVQASIRIARRMPNRHHPDFQKLMVLNTIFGGYFGSRLMKNISEDKGYTYGIHSSLQNHIQHSAWVIGADVGKDVCQATIEEIYKEMKIMRENSVSEDELMLVKNYMMGSILGDLDGPFQIIARWKNYILNNLNENYFYEAIQTIKSTSAEELQSLAKKYLNPEEFYELSVI